MTVKIAIFENDERGSIIEKNFGNFTEGQLRQRKILRWINDRVSYTCWNAE